MPRLFEEEKKGTRDTIHARFVQKRNKKDHRLRIEEEAQKFENFDALLAVGNF